MIDAALLEKFWSDPAIEPAYLDKLQLLCSKGIQTGADQPGGLAYLPLLFCEAYGGCRQQAAPLLTAWTLLRYAGRLLDDVEDEAPEIQGAAAATINLSTGLIFTAALALNDLEQRGVAPPTAADIRQTFYTTLLQICSGQHLDLAHSLPDLETCWRIARLKSGLFVGLICWAGARLATGDLQILALCRHFGINLGVMDQVRDDLTDLWSTEQRASDLKKLHNRGLPVAYALSVLPDAQREPLQAYLQGATSAVRDEKHACQLIIGSGAAVYLTVQSSLYYQRSVELVRQMGLPDSAQKNLVTLLEAARVTV